jgi:hypothetical protein
MTNIVGSALLGVTLGCARCHDHKFDPIRQSDYYRMQGFFAAVQANDVSRATTAEEADWKVRSEQYAQQMKEMRAALRQTRGQERMALEDKIEDLQDKINVGVPSLFSVTDDPAKRTEIHLLARGDYQNKGDRVGMRVLGVVLPEGAPELPETTAKPREELAKWVVDDQNPLTARVMVNRIWQYHFGRGIVGTPNDFGRMGERPTHPELLDYLANEFVASGWSVKHVHRLILLSSAYRQASDTENAAAHEKDPDNRLLWRSNRQRLEAEEIRDAMLKVSGLLNEKTGGPSVIVPIDPDLVHALYKPSQWAVTKDPAEHNRRSVYLFAKRNLHIPLMEVFDAPDSQVSCPRRESSTHAPQALELLNGGFANRQAEAFAARLAAEAGTDPARQADLAYKLAAGRSPNAKEKQIALEFLKTQPLREFALAVFNLNAFLYVN